MIYVGIDPGLSGGIAFIDKDEKILQAIPIPIKNGEFDARTFAAHIQSAMKEGDKMNNTQILNIDPQPKPRMTRSDKWRKRPVILRYYNYCNQLRELGAKLPEAGAKVIFNMPIPKSWSKKKQAAMIGKPHQQKPDLDNMLKALSDAVHGEDCHIWQITVAKYWAIDGSIIIESPIIPPQ